MNKLVNRQLGVVVADYPCGGEQTNMPIYERETEAWRAVNLDSRREGNFGYKILAPVDNNSERWAHRVAVRHGRLDGTMADWASLPERQSENPSAHSQKDEISVTISIYN